MILYESVERDETGRVKEWWWIVEASFDSAGNIQIRSGDVKNWWYAIVDQPFLERLRAALLSPGESPDTGAAIPKEEMLNLVHQRFARDHARGEEGPFEEIKAFLNEHKIPWRHDYQCSSD